MQADIQCEYDKQDFKDKVSECFDYRIKQLQRKQFRENKRWQKVRDSE